MNTIRKDFAVAGERLMKDEVDLISWSPNRDLLAISDFNGRLSLHRFANLEHIWSVSSPMESKINSLCWRPDGTVIAVAYSKVEAGIHFIHMEKSTTIYTITSKNFKLTLPSIYLCWNETEEEYDDAQNMFQLLSFNDYVPDLPEKEDTDDSCNFKAVLEIKKFNLMLSLNTNCQLTLYAYGVIPLATISCDSTFKNDSNIQSTFRQACMNKNMNLLTTVWQQRSKNNAVNTCVHIFDIKKIFVDIKTWNDVSLKLIRIVETINYISYLFEVMKEHCEDLVHQMETRLLDSIAENQFESGSVGDELLNYLVWGQPCYQLEHLLVNSLKENMLERFKKMLLMSNVFFKQTLLSNMQTATDTLYYLFNELKGMNRSKLFPDLEIEFNEKRINELIKLSGELSLKTYELLEVYLEHAGNFQLFIKWLNISIQKLKNQTSRVEKMTQKELQEVADFILESFVTSDDTKDTSGKRFNLDRIYQYFQTTPLKKEAIIFRDNEWMKLVQTSSALSEQPSIIKPDPTRTLAQIVDQLAALNQKLILEITKKVKAEDCVCKQVDVKSKSNSTSGLLRTTTGFVTSCPDFYPNWTRNITMFLDEKTQDHLLVIDILISPENSPTTSVKSSVYGICMSDNRISDNILPTTYDDANSVMVMAKITDFTHYNDEKFFTMFFTDNNEVCLIQNTYDVMLRMANQHANYDENKKSVYNLTQINPVIMSCMTEYPSLSRVLTSSQEHFFNMLRCVAKRNAGCVLSNDRKKMVSLELDVVYEDESEEEVEEDRSESEEDDESMGV